MEPQVLFDETGNEEIGMVVPALMAQGQLNACLGADGFQRLGLELPGLTCSVPMPLSAVSMF